MGQAGHSIYWPREPTDHELVFSMSQERRPFMVVGKVMTGLRR